MPSIAIVSNNGRVKRSSINEGEEFNIYFDLSERDYISKGYYIYELVGSEGFTKADLVDVSFNNGVNSLRSGFSSTDLNNGIRYGYSNSFTATQDLVPEPEKTIILNLRHSGNITQIIASTSIVLRDDDKESISLQIGNFSIQRGTSGSDYNSSITPGITYLADSGDDTLWIRGTGQLLAGGTTWWIPSIASGGTGNDRYNVEFGASTFIADGSTSNADYLRVYDYASDIDTLFSVDGRHIFLSTTRGTNILVVDALNTFGAIETIQFQDITLSGTKQSVGSLLATYQTMPNQSIDSLIADGYLNPSAMGVANAEDVRRIINSLYPPIRVDNSIGASKIVGQWYWEAQQSGVQDVSDPFFMEIATTSWNDLIQVNRVGKTSDAGGALDARQVDQNNPKMGSVLSGGTGNDQIWGKAGWDLLDGGAGNDLIRAGNGRDIITGGSGADELHGDFGWNTFKSEKDGFSDLIAIKSDQYVSNWLYGKAGNNPNGEKADIIEGLDSTDKIKVIGVSTSDLSFRAGAIAHGVSGIGIYARGALEGLYTGGDLSVAQITAMTTGDGSAAALANQVSSYGWTGV